ncbi:ABC transporter permease [Bradyrhizobium prioriisuperbiae]|uniref:ABC transporter permease n=1 Tax=Bradyrhizobium prioriisuperbiae TaxID=2854389 RepID=UPI0028EBF02D|nr:ABC transporter permease [Bradyrhizobium prioritasuperba]
MLHYLMSQLVRGLAVVGIVACLNFALVHLAPGDPASIMAGEAGAADEKYLAQLRADFGLDRPLAEQFATYMQRLAKLDLGYSYRNQRSVASLITERLPATLLLTGTAFVFALAVGVTFGVIAALFAGTWLDGVICAVAMALYAAPTFWAALLSILLFSTWLNWLPPFGMTTVNESLAGLAYIRDLIAHLVLPSATLGLVYAALYTQTTRASMIEIASQDFIKTARAKALSPWRIAYAHILPNAILPVITLAGIQAGYLLGGSVLIETVFAWPGLGSLAFDSLMHRDYNLLLGIFLATSVMVVAINVCVDLLYSAADPRIGAQP